MMKKGKTETETEKRTIGEAYSCTAWGEVAELEVVDTGERLGFPLEGKEGKGQKNTAEAIN